MCKKHYYGVSEHAKDPYNHYDEPYFESATSAAMWDDS
ncbi:hypothetical protein SNOG_15143 [Parastagonospora nodorum SN15]|uniref:Uncharacterized protein n=1 Tax=Phaeosphaeria nodorum (strain SN15 / ATCC MYA-4574 / FGSC 10173) TaxID=321614 RepID=Q0TZ13_PHANO|nr:hypothetical protein SNOG_15143 [Parastagonospora nodorum SN15]EAT77368.1 hypothetical protein SNOG_15143 [Parastagonospora nodorum SN15]